MNGPRPNVFLSSSHSDHDWANRFADRLTASNYTIWTTYDLLAGSDWDYEIQRAIDEALTVVVLLSPHSAASEWVNFEIGFARSAEKHLIPVLISPVAEVPLGLQRFELLDATKMTPEEAAVEVATLLERR